MEESSYTRLFELAHLAMGFLERHEDRDFGPEMARRLSEATGREERAPSTTECHVLDQVWRGTTTAARIAENLGMTRGGVSKAISKLAGKGFLETARSPESAREVVLALTERGVLVCEIHSGMHAAILAEWARFLDGFSEADLDAITRFLEGIAQMGRRVPD